MGEPIPYRVGRDAHVSSRRLTALRFKNQSMDSTPLIFQFLSHAPFVPSATPPQILFPIVTQ
jgi:hypothetical protein